MLGECENKGSTDMASKQFFCYLTRTLARVLRIFRADRCFGATKLYNLARISRILVDHPVN